MATLERVLCNAKNVHAFNQAVVIRWNKLNIDLAETDDEDEMPDAAIAAYGSSEAFVRSQPFLRRNKRLVKKDHQMHG
jgi:hypothetical protein